MEVAGGGRPVALGGIAAPSEVTCLLQARRLPMPYRFLALVVSAVRSGLALPPPVLAPPLSVALFAVVLQLVQHLVMLRRKLVDLPALHFLQLPVDDGS